MALYPLEQSLRFDATYVALYALILVCFQRRHFLGNDDLRSHSSR